MKKRILLLSVLFLTLTFFKCEDDNSVVGPMPGGTYSFTSYDEDGNKLVEGEFSIIYNDSKTFKGDWNFKGVGNLDNPRPQVGTGDLIGEIDENNVVSIDLNPGWADNNAYLNGKFENGRLTGDWSWIGFVGVEETGTFTATEK